MTNQEILNSLKPLFEKAEKEKLWFYSNYQDMWFSPKELKEYQSKDCFIWGADNWKLRNPKEELERLYKQANNHYKNIDNFTKRMEG